jgi:thiol:disulfide interchange protein DsbC
MVRASDGAVLQGYRPAAEIRRFLGLTSTKGGR